MKYMVLLNRSRNATECSLMLRHHLSMELYRVYVSDQYNGPVFEKDHLLGIEIFSTGI